MKKITYILFLLIASFSMGQDLNSAIQKASSENPVKKLELMSDSELLAYWEQAQAQGYSLNQLKTLARAQGVSEGDISKFEKRIKILNQTQTNDDSFC